MSAVIDIASAATEDCDHAEHADDEGEEDHDDQGSYLDQDDRIQDQL